MKRHRRWSFSLVLALLLAPGYLIAQGTMYPDIETGSKAPDFSLPYATRDSIAIGEVTLSDFAGARNVVLAFYPADWSGGCTREVCTFRDNFDTLASLDAEILAISGDYTYSHYQWAKYHDLPFKLLSDHRHRVSSVYHSYDESSGYNRRTVYLIDMKGVVVYKDMAYSTKDQESFNKLHDALDKLKTP